MLHHYYKGLVVGCTLLAASGCGISEEIARLHRDALAAERTAVEALNGLTNQTGSAELEALRGQYDDAAAKARGLRARLKDVLAAERGSSWFSGEKLAEASQLNDDLLRCHETLDERAQEAFRFVASGRSRRGSVKDVWGLVDPRTCFDELAPAWDALLS